MTNPTVGDITARLRFYYSDDPLDFKKTGKGVVIIEDGVADVPLPAGPPGPPGRLADSDRLAVRRAVASVEQLEEASEAVMKAWTEAKDFAIDAESAASSASSSASTASSARDAAVAARNRAIVAEEEAGKDAYTLAVENGFTGSVAEWLASLKGERGEPGQGMETAADTSWVLSRGTNLVSNGTGYLGNNTNFSMAVFDVEDSPEGVRGSFVPSGSSAFRLDEPIPLNTANEYVIRYWIRQDNPDLLNTSHYAGLEPLDAFGNVIPPDMFAYRQDTTTKLAKPLNPGDTVVHLESAENWLNNSNRFLHVLTLWDYKDPSGKVWPAGTYSRDRVTQAWLQGGINYETNTITLRVPYAGVSRPAGTPVSNGKSGNGYIYLVSNQRPTGEWTQYTGKNEAGVNMTGDAVGTRLPPGTAGANVIFLTNYGQPNSRHKLAGVELEPTRRWNEIRNAPATFPPSDHSHSWSQISDAPRLYAGGGIEEGMIPRYNSRQTFAVADYPQGANDVTSKRYVDREVGTRARTEHTHTRAQITDLPEIRSANTPNSLAQRTASGNIEVAEVPSGSTAAASKAYVDSKGSGASKVEVVPALSEEGITYVYAPEDHSTTGGNLGQLKDEKDVPFVATNGYSSSYHLYNSHIDPNQPIGLFVWLHGDGAWEYKNPDSDVYLAGENGIVAAAASRNMIVVVPLSPDDDGLETWWEWGQRENNALWIKELISLLYSFYDINLGRIWFGGFSGGAEFLTAQLLTYYGNDLRIEGGGFIPMGGGDSPVEYGGDLTFDAPYKHNFPGFWFTGEDDTAANSEENWDAVIASQTGHDWYEVRGWRTHYELIPGYEHQMPRMYGSLVKRALDAAFGTIAVPSLDYVSRSVREAAGAATWGELSGKPTTFPPAEHTHAWSEVTGKPSTFPPGTHSHGWAEVTGKPTTFAPATHSHAWSEVTGKPSVFTPATHSHAWSEVTGKPTTFAPATHNHTRSQITDLPEVRSANIPDSIAQRTGSGNIEVAEVPSGPTAATSKTYVDQAVASIPAPEWKIVDALPSNPDPNTLYFVRK